MRKICVWAATIATPFIILGHAHAATVTDLANITALRADVTDTNVNVQGYNAVGDGGGGQFVSYGTSCAGVGNGDDGGIVIQASSGVTFRCWVRQFSGAVHLAWYGAANNSVVTTTLKSALSAAKSGVFPSANQTVDTDGLYVTINPVSADLEIYSGVRLTCDANPGQNQTSGGYSKYVGLPGSITIANSTTAISLDDNAQLDHCIILTSGSSTYPITLDLSTNTGFRPAMNNALNMVANASTGVKCISSDGCRIHDVFIGGFDNAIHAELASHLKLSDIAADADVGIYMTDIHDPVELSNLNVQPYLTSSVSTSYGAKNDYQFSITAAAASGAMNYCQLSVTGVGSSNITDLNLGDPIYVAGVQYPLSCNGFSTIKGKTGSTITVFNSFNNPATTGSWAANSQVIQLSSVAGIWPGQLVLGTGVPAGATVVDVSSYSQNTFTAVKPEVVISAALGSAASGVSLTFCNPNTSNPNVCATSGSIGTSPIAYVYPSMRPWAGASDAGKATYNYSSTSMLGSGTCVQAGNPYNTSSPDNFGVLAVNLQCFAHEVSYAFAGTGPGGCTNCESDSHAELDDFGQIGLLSIGTTSRVGYQTMLLNGGGGVIVDSTGTNCQSISGLETNPNTHGQLAVRVAEGCLTASGLNGTGTMASDWVMDTLPGSTNGASITGSYFPKGTFFYQDPANGSPITSCAGNTFSGPNCP